MHKWEVVNGVIVMAGRGGGATMQGANLLIRRELTAIGSNLGLSILVIGY